MEKGLLTIPEGLKLGGTANEKIVVILKTLDESWCDKNF